MAHKQLFFAGLATALLAGCGHMPATLAVLSVAAAEPHVNRQTAVLDLTAEAPLAAAGGIAIRFKLPPAAARSLLATPDDILSIRVVLKTKGFLFSTQLATATVTRADIVANRAIVQFTGLAAKTYVLDIAALGAAGVTLATTSVTTDVTAGQTAEVGAKLQVSPVTPTPAGGSASLGVNLSIANG